MYAQGFLKVAAACPSSRLGDTTYNVRAMIELLKKPKRSGRRSFVFRKCALPAIRSAI